MKQNTHSTQHDYEMDYSIKKMRSICSTQLLIKILFNLIWIAGTRYYNKRAIMFFFLSKIKCLYELIRWLLYTIHISFMFGSPIASLNRSASHGGTMEVNPKHQIFHFFLYEKRLNVRNYSFFFSSSLLAQATISVRHTWRTTTELNRWTIHFFLV